MDEQMEKLITQTNARENRTETTRRSCHGEIIATFDYSRLSSSFSKLAKPAQRALINNNIHSEEDLARWARAGVAALHGIGPSAFPILDDALRRAGLKFKK